MLIPVDLALAQDFWCHPPYGTLSGTGSALTYLSALRLSVSSRLTGKINFLPTDDVASVRS